MKHLAIAASLCLWFAAGNLASAHFLWIDLLPPAGDGPAARLIFSDKPQPGERDLTDKFSSAKVWARSPDGHVADLAFTRGAGANARTMVAKSAPQGDACLESNYDYGVYTHGSKQGDCTISHAPARTFSK